VFTAIVFLSQRNNRLPNDHSIDLPWASPPDYHIVYLVDSTIPLSDTPLDPLYLEAALSTTTVNSWQSVVEKDSARPLDALLIHDSTLSMIDLEWLRAAYRRGVVIAVFNTYAPELTDILNDPYIARDNFASEPYPGDFYVIASQLVSIRGRATDSLVDQGSTNGFIRVLVAKIENIRQAQHNSE
jgi:hypothetical protein